MASDSVPDEHLNEWLRYADGDLRTARVILASEEAEPRAACFLAQQAVEKALKGVLQERGVQPTKIHALTKLHTQIPEEYRPAIDPDDLDRLDPWVIDGRYPSDLPDADRAEARRLVDLADAVVKACLASLGSQGAEPET